MTDLADTALRWIPPGPGAPLHCVEVQCSACDLRVRIVVHALELSSGDDVRQAAELDASRRFERIHSDCRAPRGR